MTPYLTYETMWLTIGFVGQGLFAMRFIYQWIYSERVGRSVIPIPFWYFSIGGGVVLLAYAIYRADPVFITGQAFGVLIYGRNLHLIHRERQEGADQPSANSSTTPQAISGGNRSSRPPSRK